MFDYLIGLTIFILVPFATYGQTDEMVPIKGGIYIPLYGTDSTQVLVNDFLMDVYPVANAQYLEFVIKEGQWRRSKVKELFAEDSYLINWKNDTTLGTGMLPGAVATNISWFAARDYCKCAGKRLPTIDEWEYVAMADKTLADARTLETYNQSILSWYERPRTHENKVGLTFKNYWGVYDLHGLVWEWTSDFNSVLISGESRKDVDKDSNLFCGSAAVGATDLMNYAAFMRYAFRGSVKANYSIKNLGFRCVKDVP